MDPQGRRFATAVDLGDREVLEMNRETLRFAMQDLPMFDLEMLHDLEQRLQKLKQGMAENHEGHGTANDDSLTH